jgi:lipid A 3-O-deacylase
MCEETRMKNVSSLAAFSIATLSAALPVSSLHATTAESPQFAGTMELVDLREIAATEYRFKPLAADAAQQTDDSRTESDALALAALTRHEPFGREGTTRLNIHGAYASDIKTTDNQFGLVGAGISYFIIENLSLDLELNGMYIDQRGSDAWAANANLLFRWHFFSHETWSLYVDGGAGVFAATKRVPSHGTHFNFTPQAGGGVSFEIAPDVRMMLGIRWHHISNASTSSNNPGRDSVMGYVGVSLPF